MREIESEAMSCSQRHGVSGAPSLRSSNARTPENMACNPTLKTTPGPNKVLDQSFSGQSFFLLRQFLNLDRGSLSIEKIF
jgi:hypothetical protein